METAMKALQRLGTMISSLLSRDPVKHSEARAADWLPPVLNASDGCLGLMASMADSSAAWYFDRR